MESFSLQIINQPRSLSGLLQLQRTLSLQGFALVHQLGLMGNFQVLQGGLMLLLQCFAFSPLGALRVCGQHPEHVALPLLLFQQDSQCSRRGAGNEPIPALAHTGLVIS